MHKNGPVFSELRDGQLTSAISCACRRKILFQILKPAPNCGEKKRAYAYVKTLDMAGSQHCCGAAVLQWRRLPVTVAAAHQTGERHPRPLPLSCAATYYKNVSLPDLKTWIFRILHASFNLTFGVIQPNFACLENFIFIGTSHTETDDFLCTR